MITLKDAKKLTVNSIEAERIKDESNKSYLLNTLDSKKNQWMTEYEAFIDRCIEHCSSICLDYARFDTLRNFINDELSSLDCPKCSKFWDIIDEFCRSATIEVLDKYEGYRYEIERYGKETVKLYW